MRGHLRQRAPGSWSLVIYLGRDPATGKKRQKWVTFYGTKRSAQRELRELVRRYEAASWSAPSSETVAEFLQRWLRDHAEANLRDTSASKYRYTVEKYIAPRLGHVALQQLTPALIQGMCSDLLARGARGGKPLGRRTVKEVYGSLRSALNCAVRWGVLLANPVQGVDAPRAATPEMKFWTQEQAMAFLEAVREDPSYPVFWLAVVCGMRRGEIAGLKWDDVDWEGRRISVQRTLVPTQGGPPRIHETKTATGRRPLDVGPETLRILRRHRARQAEEKLRNPDYADGNWIFADERGLVYNPNRHSKRFWELLSGTGLPRIRFHDLRHTCATLMLKRGEHPKVVSERLGHASVQITLDRYSHVVPGLQREAARRLEAALLPDAEQPSPPED